jgi:hypothetical protein
MLRKLVWAGAGVRWGAMEERDAKPLELLPDGHPLRERALREVREQYDVAGIMSEADLERINAPRPPTLRYGAQHEIVREFWYAAGAVATFAVRMGLLSREDAGQVRR